MILSNPWFISLACGIIATVVVYIYDNRKKHKKEKIKFKDKIIKADNLLLKGLFADALSEYKEIQRILPPDENKFYAHVKLNEAFCYLELYKKALKPELHIHNSINCLNESLKIYTPEKYPGDFIKAMSLIGESYRLLSAIRNKKENLLMAKEYLEQGVNIDNLEEYTLDHLALINNLGNVYCELSKFDDGLENSLKAVEIFGDAIDICIKTSYTEKSNEIIQNLANSYSILFEKTKDPEVIRESIKLYENILKNLSMESNPVNYGIIANNLGISYLYLATFEKNAEVLYNAIKYFKEASSIFSEENSVLALTIKRNIGTAYFQLSKFENEEYNLNESRKYFEIVIKKLNPKDNPLDYAKTHYGLGFSLMSLGVYENNREYLELAIESLNESLRVYKKHNYPKYYESINKALEIINEELKNL